MKRVRFELPDGRGPWDGHVESKVIHSEAGRFALEAVRLLAPCRPTKIVCVGRNYTAHADELGHEVPKAPLLFLKPPSAIIGPGEAIELPNDGEIHYEAELAVVIGRRCRDVAASAWREVVLGYTCLNDVSDREAQAWETNWVRAKGFDTSAPLGPWIVTADDVDEPFRVGLRLNGETRQDASTDAFLFGIGVLIETISAIMTLEPGDVIATGTPAGVGRLAPGDTVEVDIDKIGVLRNRVVRKEHGDG